MRRGETYLTSRQDSGEAWQIAEEFAAVVRAMRAPLAIGVRKDVLGYYVVYSVPAEVPLQRSPFT